MCVRRSASPGKLSDFEDELFRTAEMSETPVVMAVTLALVEGARTVRPPPPTAGFGIRAHTAGACLRLRACVLERALPACPLLCEVPAYLSI